MGGGNCTVLFFRNKNHVADGIFAASAQWDDVVNLDSGSESPRSHAPQKIVPNAQVSFNLIRGNMLGAVDLTVSAQARKLVAAAHEDAIVSTAKSFAKRPRLQQLPKCRARIADNASSSAGILKNFYCLGTGARWPFSLAQRAASTRVENPSFFKRCFTCTFTVPSEI